MMKAHLKGKRVEYQKFPLRNKLENERYRELFGQSKHARLLQLSKSNWSKIDAV